MPRPRYSNYDDDFSTLSSGTLDSLRVYSRRNNKTNSIPDASMNVGRRQSLIYATIVFLGFIIATFVTLSDPILSTGSTANYNSLSTSYEPSQDFGSRETYADFIILQKPEDIDSAVERRANEIASYYKNHPSEYNSRCDNIMIYMPDAFAFHGHGSQINTYLMAVLVSTYLDRPLLLLEPSGEWNKYAGGSQFGCPDDMLENHKLIPGGFSRLIDHPVWLHNGCQIPTCHDYGVWNQMSSKFNPDGLSCLDPVSGRDVNVIVARGSPMRGFMREMANEMVSNSNADISLRWAMNLGASQEEAKRFVDIKRGKDKWDFVTGLMVKSGILRLQPWIARDMQKFLEGVNLPLDKMFDGIHIRRGDKLETESRGPVVDYWVERGYTEDNMPLDFIPFSHYLTRWTKDECPLDGILEHNLWVATDDPDVVKQEINRLIAEDRTADINTKYGGNTAPTLLYNRCHKFTFYFNPTQDKSFHIGGNGERDPIDGDTCSARYHRNIASMVDLWMLARSRTFVGEFNSNWGRLLRVVRMRLTNVEPFSILLDTRIAWGRDTVGGPGL